MRELQQTQQSNATVHMTLKSSMAGVTAIGYVSGQS
jgi:hypothetical protein